jgi:SNF2-related domain/Helicase conserved C-terminal domain
LLKALSLFYLSKDKRENCLRITFRDGIFLAISRYEERQVLSDAGFSFHKGIAECSAGPRTCLACRVKFQRGWWTRRPEAAVRLAKYTDEKARKQLSKHVAAVTTSRATNAEIEIPIPHGLTYFGYQKAGVAYMAPRTATLLGDDTGIGKTIQVLGLINYLPEIKNVLVICPALLRANWMREAQKWLVRNDGRVWHYHLVDEDAALDPRINFAIANYNRISIGKTACKGPCQGKKKADLPCNACNGTGDSDRIGVLCGLCGGKKTVRCSECKGRGRISTTNLNIVKSLMEHQWDLLVVDEAHFIKNPKSDRSRGILGHQTKKRPGLCDRSRRKLFLTGTPIPNRPVELWPIISICAPEAFGSYGAYVKRYCNAHEEFVSKKKKVLRVDGASNLEELQERLRSTMMLRRLKKDVLKDLPPKIRQVVALIPTAAAKKLIASEMEIWNEKFGAQIAIAQEALAVATEEKNETAYNDVVAKLKNIQKVAFWEMARVRQQVAVAKMPSVIEYIDHLFASGIKKLVCFAHHKEVIKGIAEHFPNFSVTVFGETADEDRQKAIRLFQNDPNTRLFIGGITAAGTGITLTAASEMVFAELDWVPANVTQAEDRIYRIGQINSVNIRHLVLDGSLDARMAQILVEKQEIADRALDRSTEVKIESGIFDTVSDAEPEPVPSWKKTLLKQAMIILAQRRDKDIDGSHGFSGFDSVMGQKLATWKKEFSDRQAHLAITFATKYRRQLPADLQKKLMVWTPPSAAELRKAMFTKKEEKGKSSAQLTLGDFANDIALQKKAVS